MSPLISAHPYALALALVAVAALLLVWAFVPRSGPGHEDEPEEQSGASDTSAPGMDEDVDVPRDEPAQVTAVPAAAAPPDVPASDVPEGRWLFTLAHLSPAGSDASPVLETAAVPEVPETFPAPTATPTSASSSAPATELVSEPVSGAVSGSLDALAEASPVPTSAAAASSSAAADVVSAPAPKAPATDELAFLKDIPQQRRSWLRRGARTSAVVDSKRLSAEELARQVEQARSAAAAVAASPVDDQDDLVPDLVVIAAEVFDLPEPLPALLAR